MTAPKTALVTGGSSGIGEAICRALAADGWRVIVAARNAEQVQRVAAELGGIPLVLDVTGDVEAVLGDRAAHPFLDEVSLLVNNAGGARGLDPVAEAHLDRWRWMYETNVLGTVAVTKALLDTLISNDGLVVNIGSIAGRVPYVGGSGYNAAKHGVAALSRVLRLETHQQTLRVTEIDPGRVQTDFSLKRFAGDEAKAAAVYADKLNLSAADIAETVRWVASLPSHVNIDTMLIMPRDQV